MPVRYSKTVEPGGPKVNQKSQCLNQYCRGSPKSVVRRSRDHIHIQEFYRGKAKFQKPDCTGKAVSRTMVTESQRMTCCPPPLQLPDLVFIAISQQAPINSQLVVSKSITTSAFITQPLMMYMKCVLHLFACNSLQNAFDT